MKTDQRLPKVRDGGRRVGVTRKGQHEVDLHGDRIVLYLDCGSSYTNYTRDEMTYNTMYTVQCQLPGFYTVY